MFRPSALKFRSPTTSSSSIAANDGTWHYLERDLATLLLTVPGCGESVKYVDGLVIGDVRIDDLTLARGMLENSAQMMPGSVAALATQSGGSAGSVGTSQFPWARWHYQTNELGTVLAVTGPSGGAVSIMEPDGFGNYATPLAGTRPDRVGLTSQGLDADGRLYAFAARHLDPDRGRWNSEEPFGLDGPNLYHFVFNDPYRAFSLSVDMPNLQGRRLDDHSFLCQLTGKQLQWLGFDGASGELSQPMESF